MVGHVVVEAAFVGHDECLAGDVSGDDDVDGSLVGVFDVEGTDGTAALDKGDDGALSGLALLFLPVPVK